MISIFAIYFYDLFYSQFKEITEFQLNIDYKKIKLLFPMPFHLTVWRFG